jgi:AMP nucleosidase
MIPEGVKTEESDKKVSSNYVNNHLQIGIDAILELRNKGISVKHLRFE